MKTLDKILVISYVSLLVFTITMTIVFCIKDAIPDTLVISFFAIFTGEAGFCTYIWKSKLKNKFDNQ